ncbi:hypothetical protein LTR66_002470, partial [Elasticomyces elasticus]
MASPIVKATIQSAILSGVSNIIAQLINCYQKDVPYTIDPTPLAHFVLFSAMACPPNYLWQAFL